MLGATCGSMEVPGRLLVFSEEGFKALAHATLLEVRFTEAVLAVRAGARLPEMRRN